jgi:hypothetical protein
VKFEFLDIEAGREPRESRYISKQHSREDSLTEWRKLFVEPGRKFNIRLLMEGAY